MKIERAVDFGDQLTNDTIDAAFRCLNTSYELYIDIGNQKAIEQHEKQVREFIDSGHAIELATREEGRRG